MVLSEKRDGGIVSCVEEKVFRDVSNIGEYRMF